MTLIDANVLLYAYNADAPEHARCAQWLTKTMESAQTVGVAWVTTWAFLRISTNPRIWTNPLSASDAFGIARQWLEAPNVIPVQPGQRHAEILQQLSVEFRIIGPLFSDAVLAALAIENGASLASTDHDFARFTNLNWVNPLKDEQLSASY